jgi:hypothetical protein
MNVKGVLMPTTPHLQSNAPDGQQAFNLDLRRQAVFSIADAANVRIACVQGSIWITLDNDLRDFVVDDCGVFTTLEHRRALVYALKPSRVSVSSTASLAPDALNSGHARPLKLQIRMQPA